MSQKIPWFIKAVIQLLKGKIKTIQGLENLPKQGPYIIAANHQSFLDAVFMHAGLVSYIKKPIYSISKQELKKTYGEFGHKYLGMLYIDIKNKKKVLDTCLAYLKKGEIIAIFPEGRRNYDKEKLLKGKTGAARLALWAKVPVVPVGLKMPQGKDVFESIKNALFPRPKPEIYIGRPLTFERYYNQEINKEMLYNITKKIMLSIGELCQKKYLY